MPRRNKRRTNWRPQDERRFRVRGVRHGAPDTHKLARAFIALALARAEAAAQQQAAELASAEVIDGAKDLDNKHGAS